MLSYKQNNEPLIFIVLIATIIGLSALIVWNKPTPISTNYSTEKVIRYGFSIENRSSELVESTTFKVFAPVAQTPYQKLESVTANRDFIIEKDKLGNQFLVFELANIPPYGRQQISVTAKLSLTDTPNEHESWNQQQFLEPETYIESNDPDITKKATAIATNNQKGSVSKKLHKWVAQTIKPINYVAQDQGAKYALINKQGDCTEYAYTVTALARSQSILAVPVAGFMLQAQSGVLTASDYHNWAFLKDEDEGEGKWILSDPQNNVFNEKGTQYIAFRLLGNASDLQLSTAQRFFTHDRRLKVTMY